MRINSEIKLDFDDVLIEPKRSVLTSRSQVDLERKYNFLHSKFNYHGIPIIAANMDTTGTFEMNDALFQYNMMTALHKHYSKEELKIFYDKLSEDQKNKTFFSIGSRDNDFEKLTLLQNKIFTPFHICIDVANGYSEYFLKFVSKIRKHFPENLIMAGNVATPNMVEALLLAGADIVKIGVGGGSACSTRLKTGVGVPQLSAIIECADAAHGLNGHICADGGCRSPADISKAIAAGADFVMLGGMFAGHSESGGELIEINGEKFKQFYGMSSEIAMKKYHGGQAPYRASEGKTFLLPFKGDVKDTVREIQGGLRSTCTYVGAKTLKQLSKCTTFIRVNNQMNIIYGKENG